MNAEYTLERLGRDLVPVAPGDGSLGRSTRSPLVHSEWRSSELSRGRCGTKLDLGYAWTANFGVSRLPGAGTTSWLVPGGGAAFAGLDRILGPTRLYRVEGRP